MSAATLLAVALALILAGQAVAASFGPAVRVNPSTVEVWQQLDLAVASYTTAIGAYIVANGPGEDGPNLEVFVRRTTNGGESWGTPLLLGNGMEPSVAARGSAVDVVFTRQGDYSVRYRRSLDRGATFGAVKQISITNRATHLPVVARGPDGLVAIVWQDRRRPNVWVRVSQNGGSTFALPMVLTDDAGNNPSSTAVAVGNGVIYAAYSNGSQQLVMRRSTDGGSTWSAPKVLSEYTVGIPSLTAMDGTAYVAFRTLANPGVIRYRGTTNRGVSWSSPKTMSPLAWQSRDPDIALDDGGIRAVFDRCLDDLPTGCRVMYTQSTDRITWSTPQRVSSYLMTEAFLPRVGSAKGTLGRRLYVMYDGYLNGKENFYLHRGVP